MCAWNYFLIKSFKNLLFKNNDEMELNPYANKSNIGNIFNFNSSNYDKLFDLVICLS